MVRTPLQALSILSPWDVLQGPKQLPRSKGSILRHFEPYLGFGSYALQRNPEPSPQSLKPDRRSADTATGARSVTTFLLWRADPDGALPARRPSQACFLTTCSVEHVWTPNFLGRVKSLRWFLLIPEPRVREARFAPERLALQSADVVQDITHSNSWASKPEWRLCHFKYLVNHLFTLPTPASRPLTLEDLHLRIQPETESDCRVLSQASRLWSFEAWGLPLRLGAASKVFYQLLFFWAKG